MVPWEGGETSATSIDKSIHRSLRHTLVSGMSVASLKQFEPAILENLDIYFRGITATLTSGKEWSRAENMISWSMKVPIAHLRNMTNICTCDMKITG